MWELLTGGYSAAACAAAAMLEQQAYLVRTDYGLGPLELIVPRPRQTQCRSCGAPRDEYHPLANLNPRMLRCSYCTTPYE
jgi:hypothetical protein